ncbi:hypothetical protein QJS10_CPB15g00193 [Acorus calamus]|uniref:Myb/SANT-like domain-containing protein n=1 Tax=Acorus calamus TaxID=4465 RepID=A0AAV9D7J5_ACOCL|nr:hypothetical protein QJS10_CPB15g00193 [Acorus calamus]
MDKTSRSRVFWTPTHDRALLDLMVEQVHNGAREGAGFTREAWKNMVVGFNMKFNLQYDVNQLKNRLKYYRSQYNTVKTLIDQGGFTWDSASRTVVAEDAIWNDYVSKNNNAGIYKFKTWPFYEDWSIVCGPTIADGRFAITSLPLDIKTDDALNNDIDDRDDGMDDFGLGEQPAGSSSINDDPEGTPDSVQFEDSQRSGDELLIKEQSNKRRSSSVTSSQRKCKGRRGMKNGLLDALNSIAEASKLRASLKAESMKDKWPVEKCIAELKTIEGLEEEISLKALFVFKEEYNRSVFLSTEGAQRIAWLRVVCRNVRL